MTGLLLSVHRSSKQVGLIVIDGVCGLHEQDHVFFIFHTRPAQPPRYRHLWWTNSKLQVFKSIHLRTCLRTYMPDVTVMLVPQKLRVQTWMDVPSEYLWALSVLSTIVPREGPPVMIWCTVGFRENRLGSPGFQVFLVFSGFSGYMTTRNLNAKVLMYQKKETMIRAYNGMSQCGGPEAAQNEQKRKG